MREALLFVTKGGRDFDQGFSYVAELAKTLKMDISMLMVYNRRVIEAYEDVMSAAVFAEAGEFNTAKDILQEKENEFKAAAEKKLRELSVKYDISSDIKCHVRIGDALSSLNDFLKKTHHINMVLVSPSLSKSKKEIDMNKLIKKISKPIVTISQPAEAGA
ncbi:MAG: hypothetical protein JSV11_10735 [Nitrospiraceae bacterium]|nr:MAG: hypothetical protein JSV11_10735 [Nitrospiraceae bacterium]